MVENESSETRESALAFVESHWRELTLGEAHSLSLDALQEYEQRRFIKVMLTCR